MADESFDELGLDAGTRLSRDDLVFIFVKDVGGAKRLPADNFRLSPPRAVLTSLPAARLEFEAVRLLGTDCATGGRRWSSAVRQAAAAGSTLRRPDRTELF